MPVFQPAPMRKFKDSVYTTPVLPAAVTDFKLIPSSAHPRKFGIWFRTWN